MLVNKTVEFFLSEAAGWARDLRCQAADWERNEAKGLLLRKTRWGRRRCRRPNHMGRELGAARDRTRCRRGPRLGPGQDAGGKITGQAAGSERDAGDQITWQAAGSERPGTGRDAGEGR